MLKNIIIVILLLIIGIAGIVTVSNPQIKSAIAQIIQKKSHQTEKKMLSQKEMETLVEESMQTFSQSLKEQSMTSFYANIAAYWKERTSVKELNKVFAPFIERKIDLSGLSQLTPIIEKGTGLTPNGDLLVKGRYKASNATLQFKEIYKYEKNNWKLVEFFVQIFPKK